MSSDNPTPGTVKAAGVRHEDVTNLSFPDNIFEVIGTYPTILQLWQSSSVACAPAAR